MKYGELTLGQIEATVNKLGGVEGVMRLLRDEVEIVAKAAKSALTSITDLIKARRFDWVNDNITDERFPIPDRLGNDYKEFHFGEDVSSEEATKRMQAEGYESANSREFLLWDGWDGRNFIIALGSVAEVRGRRCVLVLDRDGSDRCLDLYRWDNIWIARFRFLGVRPSAPLGTGKSSGS